MYRYIPSCRVLSKVLENKSSYKLACTVNARTAVESLKVDGIE